MKVAVPVPRCKIGDTVLIENADGKKIARVNSINIGIRKEASTISYEVDGVTGSVLEAEITGFCDVKPLIVQKRKRRTKKVITSQATEAVSAALESISNS